MAILRDNRGMRSGAMLPVAVLFIVVLSMLGISLLGLGYHTRVRAMREVMAIASRCAADSGIARAIYLIRIQAASPGAWQDIPSVTNAALPGSDAVYSYTVTGTPSTELTIVSTGRCGVMQKTVNCKLRLYNPYWSGILTDGKIEAKNNFTVDSYPAGIQQVQIRTNSTVNGSIDLKNGYLVNGDLLVGPGANLDNAITLEKGTLNGTKGNQDEVVTFPSVTVPASLLAAGPGTTMSGDTTISASGAYRYTGANLDKDTLTIKSGKAVTLYIDGNLDLGSKGQIIIENGASLTVYLNGNLLGTNGDGIIQQSVSPDPVTAARSVKLFGTSNCKEIAVKNNGTFYAAVYAPQADMKFKNNMTMYGAVTSKTFITEFNNRAFYYIPALAYEAMGSIQLQLGVSRWWE